ncbi:MAG TPA: hypothetical protein VMR45_03095 [Patescibacteria group bacterium]|nr:hypothetical protein [Patescibacteria group bacterium]
MKLIKVQIPKYVVSSEPDHSSIGAVIDETIKQNFDGLTIAVRGLSSAEHPGKTRDELVAIIQRTGTDRYDPQRPGDRYENLQGKPIDLFAFRRKVTSRMQLFKYISWGFYHGSKAIHGKPVRIDMLTIYDAAQLKAVVHQYAGRDDVKRDGYIFREPKNKAKALLGIVLVDS